MGSGSSSSSSSGIGFCGLLTVAFIVLKLTGYITWSWWWVLSPMWIPIVLVLGFLLLLGIGYVLFESPGRFSRTKKWRGRL